MHIVRRADAYAERPVDRAVERQLDSDHGRHGWRGVSNGGVHRRGQPGCDEPHGVD